LKRFIALFVAIVAIAIPATASASSSVEVCFPKAGLEGVALVSPLAGPSCSGSFELITLGKEGPAGPEGKEGKAGPTGSTGPEGKEGKGIIKVSWNETVNGESSKEKSTIAGPFTLKRTCRPNGTETEMIVELSSSESFYEVKNGTEVTEHAAGQQFKIVQTWPPGFTKFITQYRTDVTKTNSYTFFATGELSAPTCIFEGWSITN
jgi:hypothetical protein